MRVALLSDTKTISSCWTWYRALLSETETISSCWTWYATDNNFPFLSPHYQSRRVIKFETISSCWTWYGTDFFLHFLPHRTVRVALLSDTETIWSCWTFYATDVCFPFLSPHYQSRHVINLKQYPAAGLGMVLIFLFFFCQPTVRFAVLLNLKQYLVAGLGMVLIFFCIFYLTEQWESPCYQKLKQYEVAGLFLLLMSLFLFYHPTIRVAMLLFWNYIQLLDSVWYWYLLSFLSTHCQIRRVIRNWNKIQLLNSVLYWYFFSFFVNPLSDSPCY